MLHTTILVDSWSVILTVNIIFYATLQPARIRHYGSAHSLSYPKFTRPLFFFPWPFLSLLFKRSSSNLAEMLLAAASDIARSLAGSTSNCFPEYTTSRDLYTTIYATIVFLSPCSLSLPFTTGMIPSSSSWCLILLHTLNMVQHIVQRTVQTSWCFLVHILLSRLLFDGFPCFQLFLGVTILLSLTVFLNLVAETLPQVSDAIPLLGKGLHFIANIQHEIYFYFMNPLFFYSFPSYSSQHFLKFQCFALFKLLRHLCHF